MRVDRSPFNSTGSIGRSRASMASSSSSGVFEEEKPGVIKSGTMQGGFTPLKGRGKSQYVVLSDRAIEIFENEKAYLKKKPSKYTIDLAIAFNVHNDHYHPKLPKCVCVMRPDDTLILTTGNHQMNKEWYEAILATAVPARALRFGRCANPQEFFEAAFDVTIVETPKTRFKKAVFSDSREPNIVDRHPHLAGARRLCFYAHTIFLCLKNVEPARETEMCPGGMPPFKPIHAFEIQRKFVANFGHSNNHFFLMMGRGAPMGTCELWAECESSKVAEQLHHALNAIIDRETTKRKNEIGKPKTDSEMPSVAAMTRVHRERAHTQPHRARLMSEILESNKNSPLAGLIRKSSTTGEVASTSSFLEAPSTSGANGFKSARQSHNEESDAQKLVAPARVFPARSPSSEITEEASTYQSMQPWDDKRKRQVAQLMYGDGQQGGYREVSTSASSSVEETEDSGETMIPMGSSRKHSPSNSLRNLSLMQQGPRPLVPIECRVEENYPTSDPSPSLSSDISLGEPASPGDVEDYAQMDLAPLNGDSDPTACNSNRLSDVSSSDSCYSSLVDRRQRVATSTSQDGPAGLNRLSFDGGSEVATTMVEDALQRAFSVGSKKMPGNPTRCTDKVSLSARKSETISASGASLATSAASSASINHDVEDHLMELDFGSASLCSLDYVSPSRKHSRTRSFGYHSERGVEGEETQSGLTPSQILLQKVKKQSADDILTEDSDYVRTDAPSTSTMTTSSALDEEEEDEYAEMELGCVQPAAAAEQQPLMQPTIYAPSAATQQQPTTSDETSPRPPLRTRCSVPVLKTQANADSTALDYACLQLSNGPSRRRTKSETAPDAIDIDYTLVEPLY